MSFANPAAFWALLFAGPIVAMYLIRNRPSKQSVSTLLFWEQVLEEPGANSFLRQLRNPGSLLLQLTTLALMVLALSGPTWNSAHGQASRQVLIIDNSASMQAVDSAGTSRFEWAIAEATAIINGKSPPSEITILESCPSPRVVCPPTTSRAVAQLRLNNVQQTDCTGRLMEAQEFAESFITGDIAGSILSVTDGNDPTGPDDEISSGASQDAAVSQSSSRHSTILVGSGIDNVGITQFRARRASADPTLWHLLLEISNFSNKPVELNLELRQEGSLIDVLPLGLAANESQKRVLRKTSAEGGLVVAQLRGQDLNEEWRDGFVIDDRAVTQLSDHSPTNVILVSSGNWFLQQVLEANPLVRLTVVDRYEQAIQEEDADSVVVFDSVVPEEWPPLDAPQPIKALVVAPTTSSRLWSVNGEINETFVGDYLRNHPLVEYVQLEDIVINSATDLTLLKESEVIVSAIEGQPLLSVFDEDNYKVIVLSVNLNRSDLPLRTSFPILLTNSLDWLRGSRPELLPQASTADEATVAVPPTLTSGKESTPWTLTSPTGRSVVVPVWNDQASLGVLTEVGIYALEQKAMASEIASPRQNPVTSITLPCNLTSRQESRLQRTIDIRGTGNLEPVTTRRLQGNLQNLILFLLMFVVVAECWLWHRRVIE